MSRSLPNNTARLRAVRYWLVGGLIALGLASALGIAPPIRLARACTCPTPLPPTQALAAAVAVFDGTVTGIEVIDPADPLSDQRVRFAAHTQWKGVTTSVVTVTTGGNEAWCGFRFVLGRRYIVYAGGTGDSLAVLLCSRTRAYSSDEAAALGPDSPPPGAVPAGTSTPTVSATPLACPTLECPPCSGPRPAGEWLAEADAVFWGQVLAVRPAECDRWVDFQVREVWKGPLRPQMTVWVSTLAWQCGQRYSVGERYVVFAQGDPAGTLVVPFCFGLVDGDARQQLGPATPVPGMTCTPPPCPCGRYVGECPNVRCACDETATPTPTATGSATPTVICTAPACPCGRLVGACPNVRCEVCTATATPTAPPPRPAWLPWLASGATPAGSGR